MTKEQSQKLFKEAKHYYVYGTTVGVLVKVTKRVAQHTLNRLEDGIVDDWGNSRVRLDDDGDLIIDV